MPNSRYTDNNILCTPFIYIAFNLHFINQFIYSIVKI